MNAKLFLDYLTVLVEPRSKLEKAGLNSDDYLANYVMPRITPTSRSKPINLENLPESLRKLFAEFDIGRIDLLHTFFW